MQTKKCMKRVKEEKLTYHELFSDPPFSHNFASLKPQTYRQILNPFLNIT